MTKECVQANLPLQWSTGLELDVDTAWDGFYLHCLLVDCQEQDEVLELAHHALSHAERLRPALEKVNARMAGPGQEA